MGIRRSEVKGEGWRSQPGGHERRRIPVAASLRTGAKKWARFLLTPHGFAGQARNDTFHQNKK